MRKQLLIGKKVYKTIPKEFSELYDFYYHIPILELSFTQAKRLCRGKRATLFEIDTLRRYQALSTMKDSQDSHLGSRKIWLNVKNTLDDKVEYISNEQLLTVVPGFPRFQVPLQLQRPTCLLFDPSIPNYVTAACNSKASVICVIEKSDTLLTKLSLHKLMDDKLADLNRLKITPSQKLKITKNFESLPAGSCGHDLTRTSLIQFMGLLNPSIEGQSDPIDLANLIPRLLEDALTIKTLANKVTFPQTLKDLLLVGSNLKLIFDKTKNLLCTKPLSPADLTASDDPTPPPDPSNPVPETMPELFKFTLADIILALTSLIVAGIAVTNSIYLLNMNKTNQSTLNPDADLETGPKTPILKKPSVPHKEVSFAFLGPNKQLSKPPSLTTLPSPQPVHRP